MTMAFATLSYARRMESVGFTRAQAEALAEEQAKLIDERLATKADTAKLEVALEAVRASLARDIEQSRQEAKAENELLRRDMTIRLGSIMVAGLAAAATISGLVSRLRW